MKGNVTFIVISFTVLFLVNGCGSSEKEDWEKAHLADTIDGYKKFLQKHRKGKFSDDAASRLEELSRPVDWKWAQNLNTIMAYEEFLQKHPGCEEADQARSRMYEMYWKRVQSMNTIEAYEEFLRTHPIGKYTEEADSLLKRMYDDREYQMEYRQLLAEVSSPTTPRPKTVEELLNARVRLATKLKRALEAGEITKEQYDELMKKNQKQAEAEAGIRR